MTQAKTIIAVGTLGGTITMTAHDGNQGVSSTLGADDLVSAIPELAEMPVELRLQTLSNMASGSIQFTHLFKALAWAKQQVEEGANGVVLVQGTDTLEESAFFLDLYWPYAVPLVLTGAMRSPNEAGADGPANLLGAIRVAMSPKVRNYGVTVVMSDEIHQARFVKKLHTTSVGAFGSPIYGALGHLQEGEVFIYRQADERMIFPIPETHQEKVLLLEAVLDEAEDIYKILPTLDYQGLVIAGVGSGHVSEKVRDALIPTLQKMPVLMASRTGSGYTTKTVYGYKGGEIDLQKLGVVMVGSLDPRKARLLLSAILWSSNKQRPYINQALTKYLQG
ncbi:asparaginase [Pelistega europaea]|uniref:Asparaginase n=1 Tax=Pelistega europaea TaxID=106147 RepID=A0A7Y4L926_9BURK|nr:asparaginase [Pelistega europaea]NOL49158.1 asparaginase [Pelistega europaea]